MTKKENAYLTITDATEVDTCWFLAHEGHDLMAVLYRDDDSAPWRVMVRTRVYVDEKVFNSDDRKTGYVIQGKDGSAATVADLAGGIDDMVADVMKAMPGGRLVKLEVHGSGEDFLTAYQQLPFVHVQRGHGPQ